MWAGHLKNKSGGMVDTGSVRFITYFYILLQIGRQWLADAGASVPCGCQPATELE